MKTVMKFAAALAVLLMIAGGCGSGPSSKADDLDAAIRDASNYLNNNVPNGSKIVILNIQSSSSDLSDYVIDELIANAVNDKVFSVVDRQQLDAIRAEQNFQFSGEVDDNSAMAIGKFFGAQSIVSGGLNKLGTGYRMRIRALEVQTAQVQGQYNRNIAKSEMISALLDGGAPAGAATATASSRTAPSDGVAISGLSAYRNSYVYATVARSEPALYLIAGANVTNDIAITAAKISGDSVALKVWTLSGRGTVVKYNGNDQNVTLNLAIVSKEQFAKGEASTPYVVERGSVTVNFANGRGSGVFVAAPATPAAPAAKAYKVGETGPAGGLIFYDKGNNSGGWRYLEAGPVETEFQAVMSVRGTDVENTQETIGSGKRNTQLFVETFKKTSGEWDTASQKADDLVFGGFDDWFIPSKAELDQMYGNLKRRNLGDFKEERYWTSSGGYWVATQHFKDGSMDTYVKGNRFYVRPIRAF